MSDGHPADDVPSVTPAELHSRIAAGDRVVLLDTRTESDFEEWHIDGENVQIVNHPYYDFLDGVPEAVHEQLPRCEPITALCAKGGASEMVVEQLEDDFATVNHLEDGMKGWARVYESAPIETDVDATIRQYRRPSSGCLAYLVVSAGEAAVIDPLRTFTERYLEDAAAVDAELAYAFDTHIHADHVSGLRALATEATVTPVLPAPAVDRGVAGDLDAETIRDGETLDLGGIEIEAIHTPGHTTGMTAYRVGDVLFTGDGLFTESVARPDLEDPEAARDAARTLHETLQDRILDRPAKTIVAPAHFSDEATLAEDGTYTAELGGLKSSMAVLSMDRDDFVDAILADMPPRPANYEAIIATNLGHERPDDEEAFELELGPNNCAASDGALTN